MIGLIVLLGTLAAAGALGVVHTRRTGRVRAAVVRPTDAPELGLPGELAALGLEPGERATLLQFSSTFCAPCRATRTLLAEVASTVPGVRHVELDVADGNEALALVRRLDIRRTPTTLILDSSGSEVRRASGVPRREQVFDALAATVR